MNNYFSKVGIFFFFFVIYYYEDKLALIRNIMHPPHPHPISDLLSKNWFIIINMTTFELL